MKPSEQSPLTSKRLFIRLPLLLEVETGLFVIASALDAIMTYYLLNHEYITFTESNPIARFFIDGWGLKGLVLFKFSLVVFVAMICQIIARIKLPVARRVMQFSTAVVTGVVIYSVLLLGLATAVI